jgi:hypothetical protein
MAAARPGVLVYEEFATLSTTPAVPSLNCLIAGASVWIQDFPDDILTNKVAGGVYGTAQAAATGAAGNPTSGTQVTMADAPGNVVGAVLNTSSVNAYLGSANVALAFGSDMTVTAGSPTVSSAGVSFGLAGVQPGDTLIITDGAGTPNTLVETIVTVNGASLTLSSEIPASLTTLVNLPGATLITAGVQPGDVLTVTASSTPGDVAVASYLVVRPINQTQLQVANTSPFAGVGTVTSLTATIFVGNTATARVASTTYLSAVTSAGFVPAAGTIKFRVERTLTNQLVPASYVSTPGTPTTNTINILGGIAVAVPGSGTCPVTYATPIYIAYLSTRQDLAQVQELRGAQSIVGTVGRIDSRNPLAVGASLALANTATPIQVFGVTTDNLSGYNAMAAAIQSRKDIYAVVPLNSDINIIASLNANFTNLASPTYAVSNGVAQKFRVVLGSPGSLPLTSTLVQSTFTGATQTNGSTLTTPLQLTSPGATFSASGVLPGDLLVVTVGANAGVSTHLVAHVVSDTVLTVDPSTPFLTAGTDASFSATIAHPATPASHIVTIATVSSTIAVHAALYLDLYDPSATFVNAGVIPGDIIEMPQNPTQTSFAVNSQYVVATVVSNQRLRIVNNGPDTALVANELPYGVSRSSPDTAIPTTQTLAYEVLRKLTTAGQVSALVAVAQSLNSSRAVICWPDQVQVDGLVNGGLARSPSAPLTLMPAGNQPGFYLAACLGGLTAGNPSQQGFTNMSIAGISLLLDSNTYFSDSQISAISNGGWLVFVQDTATALPYIVHQLTTNVSTLQFGEYSMVKNFDFVAAFYQDILQPFIGKWNITTDTLNAMRTAVNAGTSELSLLSVPRIGAPILNATITSLAQNITSADRVDLFMQVGFPAPLNTVGLYVISN